MQSQFESSWNLANLFFRAMGRPTFVSFLQADSTGRDVAHSLTNWAGGINEKSGASMYGPWKAYSLLSGGSLHAVSTTPVDKLEDGCPYAGGVRDNNYITSVSGYHNDKIDAMFALLLQYSLTWEVRFHHVGLKYVKDSRRIREMKSFQEDNPNPVFVSPAEDHIRHYLAVDTKQSPNGKYWVEFQEWPTMLPRNGVHIDVATMDPVGLLTFIERFSGVKAEFWKAKKNSPVGVISANEGETEIAIMARDRFTAPEDW